MIIILSRGRLRKALLLLCLALFLAGLRAGSQWAVTRRVYLARPLVLLDPGHGGMDGGCGAGGPLLEKELNLRMALKLAPKLRFLGLRVAFTRATDVHLGPTHRRDLLRRVETARQLRPAAMICIHGDWSGRGDQKGPSIFHDRECQSAQRLAGALRESFFTRMGLRPPVIACRSLLVIRQAPCPAVLVEVGFLSHAREAELLAQPAYQERLAETIALGLAAFLRSEAKVAGRPVGS